MSSAGDLPALLRFLTQEAKIPLSTAMSKVQELQKVHLSSAAEISKSKIGTVQDVFQDEKLAKQVLSAAKRVNKKRTSGDISTESLANKKKRAEHPPDNPAAVEASLELPEPITDEDQLQNTVLITNRAPLLLAFAVHLLKYTKPEQPPSSRLSLAQAVVSANSKTKAVSIGLDKGKTAEQEGWGEGHPTAKVMDREIHVMKRWGYEWQSKDDDEKPGSEKKAQMADQERPPLWGVDLEALRTKAGPSRQGTSNPSGLPVHNAESARAYLLKSFNSASGDDKKATTKQSAASKQAEKEHNLALLLGALDLLIRSWSKTLNSQDLDKRAWSWYTAVRPEVSGGAAGWGEKNQIKLSALLDLRK
ncbi:hypothetical protein HDK77DRAFT_390929, partial [Phyllosticta capitalensis]